MIICQAPARQLWGELSLLRLDLGYLLKGEKPRAYLASRAVPHRGAGSACGAVLKAGLASKGKTESVSAFARGVGAN